MPKKTDTRKQQAVELLNLVANGPASIQENPHDRRMYEMWVTTWVLPKLIRLQPELKRLAELDALGRNLSENARRVVAGRLR